MRLAIFSLFDWSLATLRRWSDEAGHEIVILVTQQGTASGPGLRDLGTADARALTLVVPKVEACRATLADLDVDLGVVFTFRRVPESVASLPRFGMVNVHASLLPAYRGANGYRALYNGEPQLGATLHRLTPEFDTGPILAQASEATPPDVEPSSALEALKRSAGAVLRIGVPRALAGEPGEEQDAAAASAAPNFTDEEATLTLEVTSFLFQCRFSALTLAGIQPWVQLNDDRQPLRLVRRLRGVSAARPDVLTSSARRAIVSTCDGVLELELGKLPF